MSNKPLHLQARIAARLRQRYQYDECDDTSLCAHCSDDWADNVAAIVVAFLEAERAQTGDPTQG